MEFKYILIGFLLKLKVLFLLNLQNFWMVKI